MKRNRDIVVRSGSSVFTHEVDCEGMKESSLKNLKQDLKLKGYAWIRGLIDKDDVERAREAVRKFHNEKVGGTKGITYTGMKDITDHRDVLKVVESSEIVRIFETILNRKLSERKYLRLVGPNESTSPHSDAFFFKSKSMYTCWIPFGDVRICDGPLAICEASHLIDGYDDAIAFRDEIPWGYVSVANDVVWKTTEYKAGDVVIFDARTIHGSLRNESNKYRISCDTRWMPMKSNKCCETSK